MRAPTHTEVESEDEMIGALLRLEPGSSPAPLNSFEQNYEESHPS